MSRHYGWLESSWIGGYDGAGCTCGWSYEGDDAEAELAMHYRTTQHGQGDDPDGDG